MSITFTKLFSSITESTVWCEPAHTRLVWITMLAMADKRGRVWASIPGLANRARVPLEDADKAVETFLGPDRYSRTPDHEGRRIRAIDGGWELLNYTKYRELRDEENRREQNREAQERHRKKSAELLTISHGKPESAQAEAEAEAEKKKQSAQRSRGSRLPHAWQPSEPLKTWAVKERPDLAVDQTIAKFKDHWAASPGSRGVKLDWDATFRNWVRAETHRGNCSLPSASKPRICAYCGGKATGNANGYEHCGKHQQNAMYNEAPNR